MRLRKRTPAAVGPVGRSLAAGRDDSNLLERWLLVEPAYSPLTAIKTNESAVLDVFADLVEAIDTDDFRVPAALFRFGRRLGLLGLLLEEVAASVDRLATLAPGSPRLHTFSAGISLANGWSEGHRYGEHESECIDGLTGLATLPILRLRIEQLADQSAWMGIPFEQAYCLVIIDADIDTTDAFESELTMITLAERLRARYTAGETIARHGPRVLILTSNSERTRSQLIDVLADLRSLPLPSTTRVVGWIEEMTPGMGDGARVIDFLTELTIE